MPSDHLTAQQAARILGITDARVGIMAQCGLLPFSRAPYARAKTGWRYLFAPAVIEAERLRRVALRHPRAQRAARPMVYARQTTATMLAAEGLSGPSALAIAVMALARHDGEGYGPQSERARHWLATTGRRWAALMGVDLREVA